MLKFVKSKNFTILYIIYLYFFSWIIMPLIVIFCQFLPNKKYPIIYVTSIFPKATLCLPRFFRFLFQLCSPLVALFSVPCFHCRHPSGLQCPPSLFSHAVPCWVTLSTNRKVLKWNRRSAQGLRRSLKWSKEFQRRDHSTACEFTFA